MPRPPVAPDPPARFYRPHALCHKIKIPATFRRQPDPTPRRPATPCLEHGNPCATQASQPLLAPKQRQ